MSNELIKHRLKRQLRSRGVRINRILLDVSDDRIVFSGEVASYYELQMIQVYASEIAEGRPVHNNLSVVPGVLEARSIEPAASGAAHEVHRLRNQLNELGLGIRLLDKLMSRGDFDKSKEIVTQMSASFGDTETQSTLSAEWMFRLSLLVIEDDSHQCLLLTGVLRHLGANVARACDADSTFRVLNEGFTPDIVLLDMHLPDSDGGTIASAIRVRPHCKKTKIVVLSGTHPSDVGLDPKDAVVDAWLPKPINVDKLLETIRKLSRIES